MMHCAFYAGKICISRLEMQISSLEIYIFNLEIQIFRQKTDSFARRLGFAFAFFVMNPYR